MIQYTYELLLNSRNTQRDRNAFEPHLTEVHFRRSHLLFNLAALFKLVNYKPCSNQSQGKWDYLIIEANS